MAEPPSPASARELVHRISGRLDAAAAVARAAEACAEAGDTTRALAMLPDIEPPLYEVTTMLNAASIILRGNHRR